MLVDALVTPSARAGKAGHFRPRRPADKRSQEQGDAAGLRFAFHIIGKFSVVISQEGAVSPLLLVLLIVLVLLAVGGGVWVSNLLWLLLVIALIVLVVGLFTGRTA